MKKPTEQMKCASCGAMATRASVRPYQYGMIGGLKVTIRNATVLTCGECGAESVAIAAPAKLHRAVAGLVLRKPSRLSGPEIAFLRHHMEMTGEELARHLGVSKTSVSRWENGREPIGHVPDRLLRAIVLLGEPELGPIGREHMAAISAGPPKPAKMAVTAAPGGVWEAQTA